MKIKIYNLLLVVVGLFSDLHSMVGYYAPAVYADPARRNFMQYLRGQRYNSQCLDYLRFHPQISASMRYNNWNNCINQWAIKNKIKLTNYSIIQYFNRDLALLCRYRAPDTCNKNYYNYLN
jgi:hypothetical protein